MKKAESSNAMLEYFKGILYIRIKEGAEITVATMKEQYEVQEQILDGNKYVVLVDGKRHYHVDPEARKLMAEYNPPRRLATAVVSHKNLATLMMANFYLRFNKPRVPTRLFRTEADALHWLQEHLQ